MAIGSGEVARHSPGPGRGRPTTRSPSTSSANFGPRSTTSSARGLLTQTILTTAGMLSGWITSIVTLLLGVGAYALLGCGGPTPLVRSRCCRSSSGRDGRRWLKRG
jgi:hypothetical protein